MKPNEELSLVSLADLYRYFFEQRSCLAQLLAIYYRFTAIACR
jgi:hypothetical protein